MTFDALAKAIELAAANPSAATWLLIATVLTLIAATPIAALAVVGYAIHALTPREKKVRDE
jgi:hypothetical protein